MAAEKTLSEQVEDVVNQGAASAEQIHRRVLDLPLTVLERVGLFERAASDLRKLQEASIGAVYDVVREVNHEVTKFAGELLESDHPKA
jgi:uncharacterized membrane protein